jgi:hypothetical protein
LKQYQEAKDTLERIDYKGNKDCVALHAKIVNEWKKDTDTYNSMVKKMFG